MIFDQSFIDPEPCISVKFNLILVTNTKKRRKRDIEIKRKKKKRYRLTNNLNFIIKNLSRCVVDFLWKTYLTITLHLILISQQLLMK